jgi:hypothetical protein
MPGTSDTDALSSALTCHIVVDDACGGMKPPKTRRGYTLSRDLAAKWGLVGPTNHTPRNIHSTPQHASFCRERTRLLHVSSDAVTLLRAGYQRFDDRVEAPLSTLTGLASTATSHLTTAVLVPAVDLQPNAAQKRYAIHRTSSTFHLLSAQDRLTWLCSTRLARPRAVKMTW